MVVVVVVVEVEFALELWLEIEEEEEVELEEEEEEKGAPLGTAVGEKRFCMRSRFRPSKVNIEGTKLIRSSQPKKGHLLTILIIIIKRTLISIRLLTAAACLLRDRSL